MKKVTIVLFAALMAVAFAACTEKENGNGTDDPINPPTPQHNSLYETTWSGSTQFNVTVPYFGNIAFNVTNTIDFITDSTAKSFIMISTNFFSPDTTMDCTYTWNEGVGTLTAAANSNLSLSFTQKNDTTLNITIWKSDIAAMWPDFETYLVYLPEDNFTIDLYKQE